MIIRVVEMFRNYCADSQGRSRTQSSVQQSVLYTSSSSSTTTSSTCGTDYQ